MNIDYLPDSLLLSIFRHLQFSDICKCSSVCQRWRRVTHDWSLRRVIDVTSQPLSAPQAWRLVRHCTDVNLVELRLTGLKTDTFFQMKAQRLTATLFRHLRDRCSSLKVLHLTDALMAGKDASVSRSLSVLATRLTHLSLRRSCLYPNKFFQHKPERPLASSLLFLDLANCTFLSLFDLGSLKQFPSLRGLVLAGCYPIYDDGLAHLEPLIANLVLLDIERIYVGNRGVEMVLLQGTSLRYLFVGHTAFDGRAFEAVWRILGGQRALPLTHVCLRCTQVEEPHLKMLLRMTPRLQWLVATGADMSPDAREGVEQCLPRSCQYLEVGPGNPESAASCRHSLTSEVRKANLNVPPADNS
ncbi:F-box/LRR-repeat protein 12 [Dermacentor silvarum]|uniref:F-box/LRR-repeat protein 12 n=1 Tax=Dermacentor silvarum TaxID=543639 RepID=UPI0018988E33|nr:F-box/LRR-repeat protein 12 [Dermacentor silvarum]